MSKPDGAIRVLIADNHPVTRRGIRAILEEAQDIEVVGEAENGTEAQELVAELGPNILLLDLVMPGLRPFEVARWVRTNCPNTVTLILTAHDRDFYLAEAIKAGVVGFLVQEEKPHKLVDAIRRAAQGDVLITKEQRDRERSWQKEVGKRWETLTEREQEVLVCVAHHKTSEEIAEELNISVSTVNTHVERIKGKWYLLNNWWVS